MTGVLKRMPMADVVGVEKPPETSTIEALYNSAILTASEEIPEPESIFGIQDPRCGLVTVATKGNISLFIGAKKTRKTFAISAIAAVVAGDKEVIQFRSMLGRKGKVLYIDTEQGRYDCQRVLHRELQMAGLNKEDLAKNLVFLTLRPHDPQTRIDIIDYAIGFHKDVDLVVIDGVRDLMLDINNTEESTVVVTKLMQWTDNYNIHILTILHENKSNKSPRGHIGTELENKSESVVRVALMENEHDYSTIEAKDMRRQRFDPYLFTIEDEVPVMAEGGVTIENITNSNEEKNSKTLKFEDIEMKEHGHIMRACFVDIHGMFDEENPMSATKFYKKLKGEFLSRKQKLSDHTCRLFTDKYIDCGLIEDLNKNEPNKPKRLILGVDETMPF